MLLQNAMRRQRALHREASIDENAARACASERDKLEAEWFSDGTLLNRLAQRHADTFEKLTKRTIAPSGTRTWASACSGSEGIHFVFKAMQAVYEDKGCSTELRQAFACESAEEKRKWIHAIINSNRPKDSWICIFCDATQLHGAKAKCWAHQRDCPVPSVDVFVVGSSCKDISRQNQNRTANKLIFLQQSSGGGSAQTFRGVLEYCGSHRPGLLLYENVAAMDDSTEESGGVSNMDILLAEMASRGYEGQQFLMDSTEFGLPARRRRYYVAFVKSIANPSVVFRDRSLEDVFRTLRLLVTTGQRTPPCVSKVLLLAADPAVQKELQARLAHGTRGSPYASTGWAEAHLHEFQKAGVRWGSGSADNLKDSLWFSTLSCREQDILRYASSVNASALLINVSQSITRVPSSSFSFETQTHIGPAVLPTQVVWITSQGAGADVGRLMLGREALVLQGFPVALIPDVVNSTPESLMTNLAGNAMSLPVVLVLLMSLFASVSWASTTAVAASASTEEDENEALAAFSRLASAPKKRARAG